MPLTATQIRELVKDKSDLNILLKKELQSGDDLINLAMELAVSEFNSFSPMTQYTKDNFPNDAILLYGTLYFLANSEAERQLRNQVNYSAQGLNAGIDDKYQQYLTLAQHYYQLFAQKAQVLKQHINSEAAWGDVNSPYSFLNEFLFGS